jgi:hypothetical protein
MSADDLVKIIGAIAGAVVIVLGAIGACYARVMQLHQSVNGRMTQLLELTKQSSVAQGHLEEKQAAGRTPDTPRVSGGDASLP